MTELGEQTSDPGAIVGAADVTEADLKHAVTPLPGSKRPWLVPLVMVAATTLFVALSSLRSWQELRTIVLPAVFAIVLYSYFRWAIRRAWVKAALANVGGQTTFRFDGYGFTSESSLRQHRLAWASLARVLETKAVFLVFTTPRSLLIAPKRAFSDADVARLRSQFAERITPKPAPQSAQRALLLWVVVIVSFLTIWHLFNQNAEPSHRHGNKHQHAAQSD